MTEQSATDPLPTKPPHRQSVQISCDSDQARTHQKRRLATLHRTHKSQISIASTLDPAGSFFGDFRTPAGVRNSSRLRTTYYRRRKQAPEAGARQCALASVERTIERAESYAAKLSRDLDRCTALKRECMAIIGELAALAHSSTSYVLRSG